MAKPTGSSVVENEMQKVEKQLDKFENEVKEMTLDRMNMAPKAESAPIEISSKDAQKVKDFYLKPKCTIGCKEKFNEKYRAAYEYDKQYVKFIAVNNEVIGENLDIWTRPYAGMPAEEWNVPVNKAIYGPRYLAEQIKRKKYHRLVMQDRPTHSDGTAEYYGTMSVDKTVQRLDATPVREHVQVSFMRSGEF